MKQRTLATRNAAVVLLWLHGYTLEEIRELFDLGRDRLLLILTAMSAAQGRPTAMPLEEWRAKRVAEALAKGTSTYVKPQGVRVQ